MVFDHILPNYLASELEIGTHICIAQKKKSLIIDYHSYSYLVIVKQPNLLKNIVVDDFLPMATFGIVSLQEKRKLMAGELISTGSLMKGS